MVSSSKYDNQFVVEALSKIEKTKVNYQSVLPDDSETFKSVSTSLINYLLTFKVNNSFFNLFQISINSFKFLDIYAFFRTVLIN